MFKTKSIFFMNLVITCEHGGNHIPKIFEPYLRIPSEILNSHLGYDLGALDFSKLLYQYLKPNFNLFYLTNEQTRLLIDYNRSLNHPHLFSKYSKSLPPEHKKILLDNYHDFRTKVMNYVKKSIDSHHQVIHLSIHSFTPIWKGKERKTEIGILFDPKKNEELQLALIFRKNIPFLCHFNLPYRGISDGHTQSLRNLFSKKYLGIEIEINQKFIRKSYFPKEFKENLIESILKSLKIYHSQENKNENV